jgi:hypothetical protein
MSAIDDPRHWRERAAEMRALADCMENVETQKIMQRLADDYDKLGDRAALRSVGKSSRNNSDSDRLH